MRERTEQCVGKKIEVAMHFQFVNDTSMQFVLLSFLIYLSLQYNINNNIV